MGTNHKVQEKEKEEAEEKEKFGESLIFDTRPV